MSTICKLPDSSASLLQVYHDTEPILIVTNTNTVSWGKLLVTVFAAPYLDRMPEALTLQSSINLLHRKAIAKPGVRHFANIAPYRLATGTTPCSQPGQSTGWLRR